MAKKNPLGHNPLNAQNVLRDMLRGNPNETSEKSEAINIPPDDKTVNAVPEKLLRKTMYFSKQEWQAIRKQAFDKELSYTDIVREAVRNFLGLSAEKE